ncbi:MAG: hypothetical protein GKR94_14265 [Gammaproteobacteria bacterium]|nr:hypothetical protein [Gammaproteobacteria bacterium]
MAVREDDTARWRTARFWIGVVALLILAVFMYFFQPVEDYLVASIPKIHFFNIVFWCACAVAVIGYAVAHWQSFKQYIFSASGDIDTDALVFNALQIAILIAVVFCAGATLQALELLAADIMQTGPELEENFGSRILAIIVLIILAALFYLLHYAVRAVRAGWKPRRAPRRSGPGA